MTFSPEKSRPSGNTGLQSSASLDCGNAKQDPNEHQEAWPRPTGGISSMPPGDQALWTREGGPALCLDGRSMAVSVPEKGAASGRGCPGEERPQLHRAAAHPRHRRPPSQAGGRGVLAAIGTAGALGSATTLHRIHVQGGNLTGPPELPLPLPHANTEGRTGCWRPRSGQLRLASLPAAGQPPDGCSSCLQAPRTHTRAPEGEHRARSCRSTTHPVVHREKGQGQGRPRPWSNRVPALRRQLATGSC